MAIVFKVKPWYKQGGNPDDYFDPVTHIATEENFIKFLECGVYDSKYIGYGVQLSNSAYYYNNGIWIIADANHDSANTGQTDCYDLISQNIFYMTAFGSNQNWRSSNPRTWLNSDFYSGFSTSFKAHMLKPKYNSQGSWYTDDYIILPSAKELYDGTYAIDIEGVTYPIFTDVSSRKKMVFKKSVYWSYFTRSRDSYYRNVWYVTDSGALGGTSYNTSCYIAPIMRIS